MTDITFSKSLTLLSNAIFSPTKRDAVKTLELTKVGVTYANSSVTSDFMLGYYGKARSSQKIFDSFITGREPLFLCHANICNTLSCELNYKNITVRPGIYNTEKIIYPMSMLPVSGNTLAAFRENPLTLVINLKNFKDNKDTRIAIHYGTTIGWSAGCILVCYFEEKEIDNILKCNSFLNEGFKSLDTLKISYGD